MTLDQVDDQVRATAANEKPRGISPAGSSVCASTVH